MNLDKRKILTPNSGYERQVELLRFFKGNIALTQEERDILNKCPTESYEEIGLIGCILKENSFINYARLLIASLHQYNFDLVDRATAILNHSDKEIKLLTEQLSVRFLQKSKELSAYENKVYSILFEML